MPTGLVVLDRLGNLQIYSKLFKGDDVVCPPQGLHKLHHTSQEFHQSQGRLNHIQRPRGSEFSHLNEGLIHPL